MIRSFLFAAALGLATVSNGAAQQRPPLSPSDIADIVTLERIEDRRDYDAAALARIAASKHAELRRRAALAIARDVQSLSDGTIRLWPATLYGSLDELRTRKWIEELDEQPEEESERRRYYRITRAGQQVLAAEAERLGRLARLARARVRTGDAR